MYSSFQIAFNYLGYLINASNGKGHGMHSPFVFDFITKVLNDRTKYVEYVKSEGLRSKLLRDDRILMVEDFGAGSVKDKSSERRVSSIAKNAAKPKKFAELIFRIARYYQPSTVIELGTSLGITTSYLSAALPLAKIITLEGAGAIAKVAEENFRALGLENITVVEGNFDQTLTTVLNENQNPGLIFIDGNHRKQPTLDYFNRLLTNTSADSIIIFDDIHWSGEMEEAWETIKKHPAVRCSIDLFFIGIVFFREEFREKQDFTIRF